MMVCLSSRVLASVALRFLRVSTLKIAESVEPAICDVPQPASPLRACVLSNPAPPTHWSDARRDGGLVSVMGEKTHTHTAERNDVPLCRLARVSY